MQEFAGKGELGHSLLPAGQALKPGVPGSIRLAGRRGENTCRPEWAGSTSDRILTYFDGLMKRAYAKIH